MTESKLSSMQRDRAIAFFERRIAEGVRAAVLRIAEDGVTARGSLDADLVGAARFELDFEPGASRALPDNAVMEHGVLRSGVIFGDDLGLGHAVAFVEEVAPGSLIGRDDAFDERPVRFADRAIFELF